MKLIVLILLIAIQLLLFLSELGADLSVFNEELSQIQKEVSFGLDDDVELDDYYLEDDLSSHFNENNEEQTDFTNISVQLSPSTLVYHNSPVCIPTLSSFTMTNNGLKEIELLDIKSDSDQFYPVVFQRQTLKPKESITGKCICLFICVCVCVCMYVCVCMFVYIVGDPRNTRNCEHKSYHFVMKRI